MNDWKELEKAERQGERMIEQEKIDEIIRLHKGVEKKCEIMGITVDEFLENILSQIDKGEKCQER